MKLFMITIFALNMTAAFAGYGQGPTKCKQGFSAQAASAKPVLKNAEKLPVKPKKQKSL